MTSRQPRKRLEIKRETLRRLADGDLARVAGGWIARCTYEKSGCVGQTDQQSWDCGGGPSDDCGYQQI